MQLVEATAGWKDLRVSARTSGALKELADDLRRIARFRDTRLPRMDGALFVGPPGAGQQVAAEILAHEIELPLLRVGSGELVTGYIGETEKNLEDVLRAAEEAQAVLFFDEADALFGRRSRVRDGHDRHANAETSSLLGRFETGAGIVILATNEETALPEALRRRLRWLVDFRG